MKSSNDAHSLSRSAGQSQPPNVNQPRDDSSGHASPEQKQRSTVAKDDDLRIPTADKPSAHVVLYQPEIPQNTGNIGRTCVAVNAKLWIVRPAGFRIDDGKLKRAGLDYWQHLKLGEARNWDDLVDQLAPRRFHFLSRFAKRTLWDAELAEDDVFVFGRETSGLPESILD
ncbi:hypothetical protein N9N28_06605, partial [Rubripirellula amarantea]|nr:hypothetical protein [Rubripirellula amarantea]